MAITLVSIGSTNPVSGEVGSTSLVEGEVGRPEILVSDGNAQQALLGIHTELRKMNLYNEIKTDAHIEEVDLEKE